MNAIDELTDSFSRLPGIGKKSAGRLVNYILRADSASAGVSDLEELRLALSDFRRSGKAVIAYTENPGNGSYFLDSVADKIYMGSQHGVTIPLSA